MEAQGPGAVENLINAAIALRCEDGIERLFPPLVASSLDERCDAKRRRRDRLDAGYRDGGRRHEARIRRSVTGKTLATAWDAIAKTPEEAVVLKAGADLMIALTDHIKAQGRTQAEAAKHLGMTQPRIWDLVRGKYNLFGPDHLATMLAGAGRQVDSRVEKASSKKQAA